MRAYCFVLCDSHTAGRNLLEIDWGASRVKLREWRLGPDRWLIATDERSLRGYRIKKFHAMPCADWKLIRIAEVLLSRSDGE